MLYGWNEYQSWAMGRMDKALDRRSTQLLCCLGLHEESGEYTGIVKKEIFHYVKPDPVKKLKELGDVLFYLAVSARIEGFSLQDIMEANVRKLESRYPDGFDPKRAHAPGELPFEERPAGGGPSATDDIDPGNGAD